MRGPFPAWPPGRAIALSLLLLSSARSAGGTPITRLDLSPAAFVGQSAQGPFDQPVEVDSYTAFTLTFGASTSGLANPYLAPSAAAFFANGGQRLWIVRTAGADDASLIGADGGPGARTGLQALRDVSGVGAVAIPGATSPAVQAAMIAHAEAMGDRIALLDPASASDPNAVTAQRAGLASANGYAALYFPWVVAAPAGISLTLPPSGFVAGIFARTSPPVSPSGSSNGAVWTASDVSYPVGTTLGSTLNSAGIDAIRNFAGTGILAFGARTIASNTDWQYVSVRRVGCDLAASIQAGTAWALAQPNDATLWTQLTSDVNDFMHTLFLAGWFLGTTPSQAYFVRCDASTMTATDIAEGRTILLVGFAAVQPAQFVILTIVQQRPAGASVPPQVRALALGAPAPNPARSRATLPFDLPRAGPVTLRILDVAGRTVRTLAAREPMPAGPHAQAWDGRDDSGAAAPAGVYLVRLEADGHVLGRRLALLR